MFRPGRALERAEGERERKRSVQESISALSVRTSRIWEIECSEEDKEKGVFRGLRVPFIVHGRIRAQEDR